MAAGWWHTCAIASSDNALKCWGWNGYYSVGDGTAVSKSTPVPVINLSGQVVSVDSTEYTTCAIISGGDLQCWGYNNYGQIADGTTATRKSPFTVPGLGGRFQLSVLAPIIHV